MRKDNTDHTSLKRFVPAGWRIDKGRIMTAIIRAFCLFVIWGMTAFIELFLLSAGLISQGHDKGRLISLAAAVIITPAIAYGLHRLVLFTLPKKNSASS